MVILKFVRTAPREFRFSRYDIFHLLPVIEGNVSGQRKKILTVLYTFENVLERSLYSLTLSLILIMIIIITGSSFATDDDDDEVIGLELLNYYYY